MNLIQSAFKLADEDGSGLISRDEFGPLLRALALLGPLWAQFRAADLNKDRSLSLNEFLHGLPAFGLGPPVAR